MAKISNGFVVLRSVCAIYVLTCKNKTRLIMKKTIFPLLLLLSYPFVSYADDIIEYNTDSWEYAELVKYVYDVNSHWDENTIVTIPNTHRADWPEEDLPVTKIASYAFKHLENKYITEIILPETITSIGEEVFSGLSGLTAINLPENLTEIGFEILYDCVSLTTLEIPDLIEDIPYSICEGCTSLESVVIGSGVKTIDACAFRNTALNTVYMKATVPPTIFLDSFPKGLTIYVPEGTKEVYETAARWSAIEATFVENTTSDVTPLQKQKVEVRSVGNNLMVDTDNSSISIYAVSGQMLARAVGKICAPLPYGIYFIKVGNSIRKVVHK